MNLTDNRSSFERGWIVILTAGLLCGCHGAKQVLYDSKPRPATTSIEVYQEGQKPERSYKAIAELSSETWAGGDAHAIKAMVERAKSIGAEGLIMLPGRDTGYTFNPFGRSGQKRVWKAVAIVYKQE